MGPKFRRRSARGLGLVHRPATVEKARSEVFVCHSRSDSRREHTRSVKGFANRVTRQRPLLIRKAGVESENGMCAVLSPLAVQHRIRGRVPEQIGHLAGELVYRSVYPVIRRDPEGVQEKTSPAPGVIVSSSSGRHIGVDQGCGVHHAVDARRGDIVSICIG